MSIDWLYQLILDRQANPSPESYTARLFGSGLGRIAKKVGEEAAETMVAALAEDDARLVSEIADLAYHVLVLMAARGIPLQAVQAELERRHR
ncbi:MAG: phosphoribosyl-ATP diphosphatase [Anaerolineales bacterium]|nr:phosphoribosyl-ATP diphosphatase [Anaerolineales bacterium]MCS7248483.1 phosphoribosyl-ATP diphosphatase [Anaerolineales bacterium]MDW8162296.1 phosphoribosyl-ATP diphosphatase [Anaerolineales bacterium]MDW8448085.1 phosphoribosyl-ATP diphosphatase [Anaerolineales bacterium]